VAARARPPTSIVGANGATDAGELSSGVATDVTYPQMPARLHITTTTVSGGDRMTFHPTQSAQLAALRRARFLEEAAIARMVPRRPSSLRRRLAALLTRRGGRPESAETVDRPAPPQRVGDAVVAD
jgi:hypothetical protein